MVTLHDTEIDGVRCFWVETGRPTLAAQLIFRQGMADESLPESGWLHMLEHLALHGRGGGALHVNGSVSLLLTSFDAHGPVEAVAEHFSELSRWLSEPEFHEFDRERGVLRAEANLRGGSVSRAFAWRYGAQGPGICAQPEPGLGRATPELLIARAHRVFTRDNAVLVLDGPPPPSLKLRLPEGQPLEPRRAAAIEDNLPAAYVDDPGLVLSGVVERSHSATWVPDLLQRALRERLRDDAGAAYAPWATYEPVDDDHALIVAGSDLLPDLLPNLVDSMIQLKDQLAGGEPSAEHIAEMVAERTQALLDPYSAYGIAIRAAHSVVNGRKPQTIEEIEYEVRNPDLAVIHGEIRALTHTLMLGIPGAAGWSGQLPMISFPQGALIHEGRRFRHRDWPASDWALTVSDDRIQVSTGVLARKVELEELAGLMTWQDGARTALAHDGWALSVDPTEWTNGKQAVAELDRLVPAELRLPQPLPFGGTPFARMSVWKRWAVAMRRLATHPYAMAIAVVFGAVALALGVGFLAIWVGHVPPLLYIVLGVAAFRLFRWVRSTQ